MSTKSSLPPAPALTTFNPAMSTSEYTATSPLVMDSTSTSADLSSLLNSLNIKQSASNDSDTPSDQTFQPAKPLIIYTPAQLLKLHKSFLVQPPVDMPDLKSWFGYVAFASRPRFPPVDSQRCSTCLPLTQKSGIGATTKSQGP